MRIGIHNLLNRELRRVWVAVTMLVLAGCASPSGEPATGFINHDVQNAYIPLAGSAFLVLEGNAAAVSLGGGVAVTNAHNDNLLDAKSIIGKSASYDLLFFHLEKATAKLPVKAPAIGENVIAYGQGPGKVLRKAEGVVTILDAPVKPKCSKCVVQSAFTFEGNAGPGFSGGPVIDAGDGHLLGIVFGYVDDEPTKGHRTIYAYSMRRVFAELSAIEGKLPVDTD